MAWTPVKVDLSGLDAIRRPLRLVECYGTVGGFAVGGALAGMRLTGCIGAAAPRLYDANQALLGTAWKHHTFRVLHDDPPADVVAASLPYRGVGGNHDELADVIGYAGRIKAAAIVLALPLDFWQGADAHGLMQTMRDALERKTVCKYRTTYLLVDDLSCGGVLDTGPQCFAVLSQAPFGVERPDVTWLPTVYDAIGDLKDNPTVWDRHEIPRQPTWWSASLRTPDHAVDGHDTPDPYGNMMRVTEPFLPFQGFKPEGIRWIKHPVLDRHLTHREGARLMGFPDAWNLEAGRDMNSLGALWGTGPTVGIAQWLLYWVDMSLHGMPGVGTGVPCTGPGDARWTFAAEITQKLAPRDLAVRQWGPDWRSGL